MKYIIPIIILCLGSFSKADEQCNDITQCKSLIQKMNARIKELQINSIIVGDFLKNPDGTIKTNIDQKQASELCKTQGQRLPTAKELAILAMKNGADLFEVEQIPSLFKYRMRLLKVINPTSNEDIFYYNEADRWDNKMSPDNNKKYWLWSSSTQDDHDQTDDEGNPVPSEIKAMGLYTEDGYIGPFSGSGRGFSLNISTALCVITAH